MSLPTHLLPDRPGHGVVRYAAELARALGAPTCRPEDLAARAPRRLHVHVTDRLFGASCEEAAEVLVAMCARQPTTLTLHDVPQPGDGAAFPRRVAAYRAALDAARGWVVNSEHEHRAVLRHLAPRLPGRVVPLPVIAPETPLDLNPVAEVDATVVGLLGWIYPGKGHLEVIEAAGRLPGPVVVRALGAASEGHADLPGQLAGAAQTHGVGLEVTGFVAESALAAALAAVDVPVAAHRNVSASASINTWVAHGRRPLVRAGDYTREMDRLRPGTLTLVGDDDLGTAIARALADPSSTRLAPGTSTRPGLADVAAAYASWWADLEAAAHPVPAP